MLGGFDGYKWLNDLNVLDVGKLEETAITTQVRVATASLRDVPTALAVASVC